MNPESRIEGKKKKIAICNEAAEILPEVWPIAAFLLAAATVALLRYRTTLD